MALKCISTHQSKIIMGENGANQASGILTISILFYVILPYSINHNEVGLGMKKYWI